MSRIQKVFARPGHKALIAYVTVGYPSIEATLTVVPLLAGCGCDLVELGIPFSDPLADGVTIQRASFEALKNGVTPKLCMDTAKRLTEKIDIPLVFMTYYNPILHYGHERFCRDCLDAGIAGLIIPDLPPDESHELEAITRERHLDLIYILAPTSTEERIRLASSRSRGFIYLASVAGVTGVRERLPSGLEKFVTKVRRVSRLPICIGFGISSARQAAQAAEIADGVIIGSKIVDLMSNAEGSLSSLPAFIEEVRYAINRTALSHY